MRLRNLLFLISIIISLQSGAGLINDFNYRFCNDKELCIKMQADIGEVSVSQNDIFLKNLIAEVYQKRKLVTRHHIDSGLFNKRNKQILNLRNQTLVKLIPTP